MNRPTGAGGRATRPHISRRRKGGIAAAVVALLIVASLILTGLILVYRPLATTEGEYRLLGLEQRAEVLRDGYGVPHIYAQNAHDLFYLQGYVTAQDRLFQMDLYRRAGSGRLAEVLGEPGLESDRLMRTLGLARVAAAELPLLREDTQAALAAYADGVNKFLEQHGESLPLEFIILGYRPYLWTPVDSIVVAKLQAFDAATNYTQELLRAKLVLRFGSDILSTLMPDASTRSAVIDGSAWSAVASLLSADFAATGGIDALRAVLPAAVEDAGSNCWALAPSRTASGKPLLAGDPHLPVRNPSIWYEIGLEGAGYKVVGFSFAGIPAVVIGHNDRIAWSLTYAHTDTQDLFVERQDPTNPQRYEYRGAFEPATVVTESIGVKGRDPERLSVTITRHGPIITPVLRGQTAPLALRWTALEPGRLLDYVFAVSRARNWSEFRAAAEHFAGAAVSACYADVDGHIGYQLVGRLPARKGDGRMPVPGWTGEYDWTGLVPADANPSVADPPSGVVINANDRPSQDSASAGYMGEWDPGFRAATIAERLERIEKADLASMRSVQTDFTSRPVQAFRAAILSAAPSSQRARDAQEVVRAWDGTLAADSAGAAIYESWLVRMCERVFKERLGEVLYREYAGGARVTFALYQLLRRPSDPWLSENGDPGGIEGLSGRALEDATAELARRLGNDPKSWRWGELHTVTFAHPLAIGPLALLLNIGPIQRPGDGFSVNNHAYRILTPFAVTTHPSERMIVDLSDLDGSLSVTPIGQSGQPGSKYWGDQVRLWAAGEYKPMRFSRDRLGRLDGSLVFRPR